MPNAQLTPDPAIRAGEIGTPQPPRKPRRDATPAPTPSRRILGMRVDATRYEAASHEILERGRSGAGGMVCVATVHMVMESWDDPGMRRLVNAAEIVTPDGVPLVWGLRRLGIPGARRVYGPSLTDRICRDAAAEGVPVGFYGGTPQLLESLVSRLTDRHPGLRVALRVAPPFRAPTREEDQQVVAAIRESGVQVLFVGLGCPKQERWMAAHREVLPCAMVGVGAAFDFLAGAKRQAPRFVQTAGLEWLFRLACEPRRLWRRYLIHNPRFALRFALQLARGIEG
jgi:N-acetylglucosaminyldiphosphoundecaprenol N-acetyl-beta-D-mannosaminyltransferase